MKFFTNDFTVTFTNAVAANKAKQIADEAFRALRYDRYSMQPSIRAANSLTIEDDVTLTFEESCFDSLDLLDASSRVIKILAYGMNEETFEFHVRGSDTYTDGWIEGNYQNGVLEMTNAFYPEGYSTFLHCYECGAEVVLMEDYDPHATYVCPECGEEIDLSSAAPDIEREIIKIC